MKPTQCLLMRVSLLLLLFCSYFCSAKNEPLPPVSFRFPFPHFFLANWTRWLRFAAHIDPTAVQGSALSQVHAGQRSDVLITVGGGW